jgi:hypothetical protein
MQIELQASTLASVMQLAYIASVTQQAATFRFTVLVCTHAPPPPNNSPTCATLLKLHHCLSQLGLEDVQLRLRTRLRSDLMLQRRLQHTLLGLPHTQAVAVQDHR